MAVSMPGWKVFVASSPTVGVGSSTGAGDLFRTTSLPTFNTSTICGFFYYFGQSADWQTIGAFSHNTSYSFMGVTVNTDDIYLWTADTGVIAGPTLSPGNWYFWAMVNNGVGFTGYITPANVAITAAISTLVIPTPATEQRIDLLAWPVSSGRGHGFVSRVRAWSSVLSIAELNAERVSGVSAAKAGATFDTVLDSTSNLGGWSTNGTIVAGP
jgi:hypothetical protein